MKCLHLQVEKFMANNKLHLIMQFAGTPNVCFSSFSVSASAFPEQSGILSLSRMLIHSPNGAFSALFYFIFFLSLFVSDRLLFCRINTFKLPNLTSRFWWSNWRYLRTCWRSTLWLSIASSFFSLSLSLKFSSAFFFLYISTFSLIFVQTQQKIPHQVRQDNVKTINFHRLCAALPFLSPTKLQQLGFY